MTGKAERKQVLRLLNDLKPNTLAIEKFISNNQSASLLNVFFDEIKAVGKRKGLRVLCFAPSTVKKHVAKNGWADKKEVAKAICTLKSSYFNNYVPTGTGTSNFSKRVLCFFDTSVRYSFPFVIFTTLNFLSSKNTSGMVYLL